MVCFYAHQGIRAQWLIRFLYGLLVISRDARVFCITGMSRCRCFLKNAYLSTLLKSVILYASSKSRADSGVCVCCKRNEPAHQVCWNTTVSHAHELWYLSFDPWLVSKQPYHRFAKFLLRVVDIFYSLKIGHISWHFSSSAIWPALRRKG